MEQESIDLINWEFNILNKLDQILITGDLEAAIKVIEEEYRACDKDREVYRDVPLWLDRLYI